VILSLTANLSSAKIFIPEKKNVLELEVQAVIFNRVITRRYFFKYQSLVIQVSCSC